MGSEGGGIDLNFGTPEPVLWAIRSPSPRLTAAIVMVGLTSEEELRRSEKEVGMKKEELLLLLLVVDDEKEKVASFCGFNVGSVLFWNWLLVWEFIAGDKEDHGV